MHPQKLQEFLDQVLRLMLRELDKEDWQWADLDELARALTATHPEVARAYEAFQTAYRQWQSCCDQAADTQPPHAIQRCVDAIIERDETRLTLLKQLRNISLQ